MIPLIMLGMAAVGIAAGMVWAKANIHKDVSSLYSTRPLSIQQIEVLNQELREIKAALSKT